MTEKGIPAKLSIRICGPAGSAQRSGVLSAFPARGVSWEAPAPFNGTGGWDREDMVQRRQFSVAEMHHLAALFRERVQRIPGIRIHVSRDAQEAACYISEACPPHRTLLINKSYAVQELAPHLTAVGCNLEDTYAKPDLALLSLSVDRWPGLDRYMRLRALSQVLPGHGRGIGERTILLLPSCPESGSPYSLGVGAALLGASAASVEPLSLFFAEHMGNITHLIRCAQIIFVLVPIDRIAESEIEAAGQVRMAVYHGIISMVAELQRLASSTSGGEPAPSDRTVTGMVSSSAVEGKLAAVAAREWHLILLDNGRSALLGTEYEEALYCISCHACSLDCPMKDIRRPYAAPYAYLRAVLRKEAPADLCLQCGACSKDCPLGLRVSALIRRATSEGCSVRSKLSARVIGRPDLIGRAYATFPWAAKLAGNCVIRKVLALTLSVDEDAPLPVTAKLFHVIGKARPHVDAVYFLGCAARFFEPWVARSTLSVAEASGFRVQVLAPGCCGLPKWSKGEISGAKRNAEHVMASISRYSPDTLVFTDCPSCAFAITKGYAEFFPDLVRKYGTRKVRVVTGLESLVCLRPSPGETPDARRFAYHLSCHLAAVEPGQQEQTLSLLTKLLGYAVPFISEGCCGMGGTYGYTAGKYRVAREIGKPLATRVSELGDPVVLTECPQCRRHISAMTGVPTRHPIEVVAEKVLGRAREARR